MKNIISKIRKRIFGINILDLYGQCSKMLDMDELAKCIRYSPMIKVMGQDVQMMNCLGHVKPILVLILVSGERRIVIDKSFYRFSYTLQKFFVNHELGHINDSNFKPDPNKIDIKVDPGLEIVADNYALNLLSRREIREVYRKLFKPMFKFYNDKYDILMSSSDISDELKSQIRDEYITINARHENVVLKHL